MNGQQPDQQQKGMGTAMYVLAWLAFMLLLGLWFNEKLEQHNNPNQSVETRYESGGVREVVLQRNRYGHYVTSGSINGVSVVFMLDTGATGVAIPAHIAKDLGIRRGQPFQAQTANGTTISYAATLDRVSVGEIELNDVSAGITPGLQSDQVLLGMSFLRHIEFTQRGNTLILRQLP